MPSVAVAGSLRFSTGIAVVDGEVERHHTVAPGNVGFGECRRGGSRSVGGSMPSVAVAGSLRFGTGIAVVDGEVERPACGGLSGYLLGRDVCAVAQEVVSEGLR